MPRCIFCKSTTGTFTTREHILPESLGGGDWAVLPNGLLCDQCHNIFGSSIEQQALGDYPFSFLRVFLSIPTKKEKAPWFNSWEGVVKASLQPGTFRYEPTKYFQKAIEKGQKKQIRLIAHPSKPRIVCRFLMKMGLEVVADGDSKVIFNQKYDKTRNFALHDEQQGEWWYLQYENMAAAYNYITQGVTVKEWAENAKLELVDIEDGAEVFHLKLLYLDMFAPLENRIKPPPKYNLLEPEYRLFLI